MFFKKIYFFCFFVLFSSLKIISQNKADSIIKLVNQFTDTVKISKYQLYADKLFEQNDSKSALIIIDEADKVSNRIENKLFKAKVYRMYAFYYRQIKYYNKAIEYIQKAIEINKSSYLALGSNYHFLGSIYEAMEKKDLAVESYYKSIAIREKINDDKGLGASYNNLGNVYNSIKKNDLAVEALEKSLVYRRKTKDVSGEAGTLNNMGLSYSDKHDYKKAIEYYEKSIELKKQSNDIKRLGSSYNNIGTSYYRIFDYTNSIKNYRASIDCDNKAGLFDRSANACIGIARCYIQLNNKDSASYYLKLAEKKVTEINSFQTFEVFYGAKSEYDSLTNNLSNYIFNSKKSLEYAKLKFDENVAKNLNDLRITHDLENQERQIELLNKSKLLQDIDIRNKQLLLSKNAQALLIYSKEQALNELIMKQKNIEITQSQLIATNQAKDIEALNNEKKLQAQQALQQAKLLEQQKYIIYLFVFLGLILLVVIIIVYRNNLQRKRFNKIIVHQKNEVLMQKEVIEEKQKEIIQSIQYAKRIQESMLPSKFYINKNINKNG